jgi:catechol 2,3-dioxygenase-like lactoylglutathione lyase family enzyme
MITRALLLCVAVLFAAPTQPAARREPTTAVQVTGAFFALSVRDLDASAHWYSDVLDLHVVMRTPKTDKAAVVVLEGGGLIVELIRHDDAVSLAAAARGITDPILVHGIVKAGLVVRDFDALLARLRARQARIAFGPYPARPDQRANVIVEDNAGNLIQFFGDRPEAHP